MIGLSSVLVRSLHIGLNRRYASEYQRLPHQRARARVRVRCWEWEVSVGLTERLGYASPGGRPRAIEPMETFRTPTRRRTEARLTPKSLRKQTPRKVTSERYHIVSFSKPRGPAKPPRLGRNLNLRRDHRRAVDRMARQSAAADRIRAKTRTQTRQQPVDARDEESEPLHFDRGGCMT